MLPTFLFVGGVSVSSVCIWQVAVKLQKVKGQDQDKVKGNIQVKGKVKGKGKVEVKVDRGQGQGQRQGQGEVKGKGAKSLPSRCKSLASRWQVDGKLLASR